MPNQPARVIFQANNKKQIDEKSKALTYVNMANYIPLIICVYYLPIGII